MPRISYLPSHPITKGLKKKISITWSRGSIFERKKGIGLLFIVEAMKKVDKEGVSTIWVTFVDMGANKVLMTERMEGTGGGIGFRNFWASTIFNVIETIDKKKYKSGKSNTGTDHAC
jgi:hypothetical protein